MRHPRHGDPRKVLEAAVGTLEERGAAIVARSRTIASAPLGPSRRRYANAAVVAETDLAPGEMLALVQGIERDFGRRRRGQRWGARVLDLDVILWSGGAFVSPALTLPHPHFRNRTFVLGPASEIAPGWRDPLTGLTLGQLQARLTSPTALPRAARWSGP